MQKAAAKLGDGIRALNISLGRDEKITQLRDGERAAAVVPVAVRRLARAMDEKSLIAAHPDGIDMTSPSARGSASLVQSIGEM